MSGATDRSAAQRDFASILPWSSALTLPAASYTTTAGVAFRPAAAKPASSDVRSAFAAASCRQNRWTSASRSASFWNALAFSFDASPAAYQYTKDPDFAAEPAAVASAAESFQSKAAQTPGV